MSTIAIVIFVAIGLVILMRLNDREEGEEGEEYGDEEETINAMQSKLSQMDEETKKLDDLHKQIESQVTAVIDKEELDSRSVYIGNVC